MRILMGILTIGALAGPALAQSSAQPAKPKLEVAGAHDTSLTKGPDLYQRYCAVCHGKDGNGGEFPVGTVRQLLGGGSSTPAHGSEEMPIWGPVFRAMSPDENIAKLRVDNLLRYLESIQQK